VGEPVTRNDLDQVATTIRGEVTALRGDLDTAVTTLRGEMTTLRGDLDTAVTALRGEMAAMEARLARKYDETILRIINQTADEVGKKVASVMMEQLRDQVAVVDEKYKDLPRQYAELRADVDGHVADVRLHRRPPATPAKRARRS
jgi:hypothetical protein